MPQDCTKRCEPYPVTSEETVRLLPRRPGLGRARYQHSHLRLQPILEARQGRCSNRTASLSAPPALGCKPRMSSGLWNTAAPPFGARICRKSHLTFADQSWITCFPKHSMTFTIKSPDIRSRIPLDRGGIYSGKKTGKYHLR